MVPRWIARPVLRLAGTRSGSRISRLILPRLDRLTARLTRGRRTFTQLLVPTLLLTTTGRRSGQLRVQPLVYVTEGAGWAVIGSNWGQRTHPAWTHNLLADPEASIRLDGTSTPVRAELVTGDDRARLFARFEDLVPSYTKYRTWAGDREIRIFVLRPS